MGTEASRTRSSGVVFDAPEDEIDGGGSARSLGHSILTGNDPLRDAGCDVRDVVNRHFAETTQRPSEVHPHFVRAEVVLA